MAMTRLFGAKDYAAALAAMRASAFAEVQS